MTPLRYSTEQTRKMHIPLFCKQITRARQRHGAMIAATIETAKHDGNHTCFLLCHAWLREVMYGFCLQYEVRGMQRSVCATAVMFSTGGWTTLAGSCGASAATQQRFLTLHSMLTADSFTLGGDTMVDFSGVRPASAISSTSGGKLPHVWFADSTNHWLMIDTTNWLQVHK